MAVSYAANGISARPPFLSPSFMTHTLSWDSLFMSRTAACSSGWKLGRIRARLPGAVRFNRLEVSNSAKTAGFFHFLGLLVFTSLSLSTLASLSTMTSSSSSSPACSLLAFSRSWNKASNSILLTICKFLTLILTRFVCGRSGTKLGLRFSTVFLCLDPKYYWT